MEGNPPQDESDVQGQIHALNARITANHDRIEALEGRADVDMALIAELQADGVLRKEHAAQMEAALRSSRRIGAAIGIVMANRKVDEAAAFALLSRTSQNLNKKVRDVADEVVTTGELPPS